MATNPSSRDSSIHSSRNSATSFPEIKTRAEVIKETLTLEEESFNKTLDRGMEKFEKAAREDVFPPEDAFQLYDTYGFPP